MGNVFSSPGGESDFCHVHVPSSCFDAALDPVFYLHHAGLDRVWWLWQETDRKKRLTDVSGNIVYNTTEPTLTLDFKIKMDRLAPLVPVRDVMDTRGDLLCYIYV
jgi:tyrosinase